MKFQSLISMADFVCFSSDFDITMFNSITVPNPLVVAWEIPRRQGVRGEKLCCALLHGEQASLFPVEGQ